MRSSTMKDASKKLRDGRLRPVSDDAFACWRDSVPIIDIESNTLDSGSDVDEDDLESSSSTTTPTAVVNDLETLTNGFVSLSINGKNVSSSMNKAIDSALLATPLTDASSAPTATTTPTNHSRVKVPIVVGKPSCSKVRLASPRPKTNPDEDEGNEESSAHFRSPTAPPCPSHSHAPQSTLKTPPRRRAPTPPPAPRKRKLSRDDDEDTRGADEDEVTPRVKRIRFILPTPSEAQTEPLTIKLPPARKLSTPSSPTAGAALDSTPGPKLRPILKPALKVAPKKHTSLKEDIRTSGKKLRTVKLVVQKHKDAAKSNVSRHNAKRTPLSPPDSPLLDVDSALDDLIDRLQQPQLVAADQRNKAMQIKQAFADYGMRLRKQEQRKELRRDIRQHQRLLVALLAYDRA
ncbi:hypothetical protein CONPUDRAFT_137218 [Coniophora puteana RWD-64-598 SS2]|uniref:Uncharacterized protein n=1 Tax=Coniophora puteana (strain RWD-64-598) TaxID=741705 RepID=A0A5M3MQY2_CONPW|nr:uncharacterized protein CONPUDRAFT_137218 [Coniophora puteana RWD-64-598 SS2]EIW81144.1 hypothetical protein CONPUDRAFT_137218 [Coniophora puteana RWD-64-598 SS2]